MRWWTLQQLKFKNPQTRGQAVEKLAETRSEEAIECLMEALQDEHHEVRLAAVKRLASIKEPRALPSLLQAVRDPKPEVREAVVAALVQFGDASCVDVLVGSLKDLHPDVREAAVEALGQIRHARALEPLILALTDTQSSVRRAALGALQRLDPNWERSQAARRAIPGLKAALSSKEYWVRQAAADTLAKISDMPKAEPGFNGSSDPIYYKRTAILQALVQALGDWDRDIRLAAAEALGRLADPRSLEALSMALEDVDQYVRETARQAAARLPDIPGRAAQPAVAD